MATNINPKISIITVTRNRAGFIARAIKSAQNQSFTSWELLILDDDSNDATEATIAPFMAMDSRITYHKNSPALGISRNRNRGLSLSSGEYIAVLDSDDFWIDNDKLKKQVGFLEKNPEYVLIGSNIKIVDERENLIKVTNFATEDIEIRNKILKNNQIPHSSVLIRKEMIDKAGGYNQNLSCVEDFDLFLKLGKLGKLKNLKEATTAYTRHTNSFSQQKSVIMAWNHYKIAFKNFSNYPRWSTGLVWSILRLAKSILK